MSSGRNNYPSLRAPQSGAKQTPICKEIALSLLSVAPRNDVLMEIYSRLRGEFGPQNWWPADTGFEIIIGAILTQNTAWPNVERAIENLKKEKVLTPQRLYGLDTKKLRQLIRPSGYYNVKAKRIKAFLKFLFENYSGSLKNMLREGLQDLRRKLLEVNGIGPETADSILLYAAGKPIFVVDAYTKRIFSRHGLVSPDSKYEDVQRFFMGNLPLDAALFNEYHALIVELGKNICKTKPKCEICPIKCQKTVYSAK